MLYDAVVVGAGPAGASAAHVLAQGGARVLLLEKARLPRYKPCGGGLTLRARMASPLAAAYQPETSATTLLLGGRSRSLSHRLPQSLDMVMRDRFDAYLAAAAAQAGADLRDQCRLNGLEGTGRELRLTCGTEAIRARYVIGADGANGVTARLAGFPPSTAPAVAIEVEVAVGDAARARYEDAALIDLAAMHKGYGWIFGKGDHLSAGIGTQPSGSGSDLRPALQRFLANHPDLRGGTIRLQQGHRIPVSTGRSHRRRGAVLLAGDAASLADPLTGEGIPYALASGRRAGATVLAALAGGPDLLPAYDRYLNRELIADLRYAYLIASLIYRTPDLVLHLLERHASARAGLSGALCGTMEYRTVLARLLRGSPKLLRSMLVRRLGLSRGAQGD